MSKKKKKNKFKEKKIVAPNELTQFVHAVALGTFIQSLFGYRLTGGVHFVGKSTDDKKEN